MPSLGDRARKFKDRARVGTSQQLATWPDLPAFAEAKLGFAQACPLRGPKHRDHDFPAIASAGEGPAIHVFKNVNARTRPHDSSL